MKIIKKLLSFILSAQMVFTLSAAAFAEDNIFHGSQSLPPLYGSIAGPEDGKTIVSKSLMSLLPTDKQTNTVFIDRTNGIPDGLDADSFYVREVFPSDLTLGTSFKDGKVLMSINGDNYRAVTLNDIVSFKDIIKSGYETNYNGYDKVYIGKVSFMIGSTADDQLDNTDTKEIDVTVYFRPISEALICDSDFQIFNSSGKKLTTYQNNCYSLYGGVSHIYKSLLPDALDENETLKLKIVLPSGLTSANTAVYMGYAYDEADLANRKNITNDILGSGIDVKRFDYCYLTFVVTGPNGVKSFITVNFSLSTVSTYIRLDHNITNKNAQLFAKLNYNGTAYESYITLAEARSFDELDVKLGLLYREFIESSDKYVYNSSKIAYACEGYYKTYDEIVKSGAPNIKDQILTETYDCRYSPDFSKAIDTDATLSDGTAIKVKIVYITAVDTDGDLYHTAEYFGIINKLPDDDPEPEPEPSLSNDTYFNVWGANKELPNESGYAPSYNYYKVSGMNDSYYSNGLQTVLLLDGKKPVADGTTIYPVFSNAKSTRIFTEEGRQTSKESPLIFKSGKAVHYSASAENGKNLKNYWVTFVTQQQGPKLFVNAANADELKSSSGNPKREVFLNNSYGFKHDIFFANIGDEELTGINVSLSPDTTGVKLDEYWTVIDSSVKKLNPFTTTNSNKIDNIAKVRLVPEDDGMFAPIKGMLTISTENGGSVNIDLTGVAGVPKIVTDKLYDGVKYVPYSYVIMTNSMYESDAMQFSITEGKLPDGIELKPNGELYGIPTETGSFEFTVTAKYCGKFNMSSSDCSAVHTYVLTIKDNDDANVDAVNEDAQGYSLENRVSKNITVYYNGLGANDVPVIDRIELDSDLFWSEGSYSTEFINFYIDGYELKEGVDYYAEEGSTKITVKAQTFGHTSLSAKDIPHTLAGEFRTNNKTDQLRRSAQNVYINYVPVNGNNNNNGGNQGGSGGSGNNGGNSGNSAGGTIAPTVSTDKTVSAVSASFTVVDAEGDPISGIMLELHSTPQYAKTDSNGVAKFDTVEFGKHTIYIKNLKTGKKVSGSFTLESGSEAQIKDNVITAKNSDPVSAIIRYDGKSIELLSATVDNIESGAGMVTSENVSVHSYGYAAVITISALAAVCASFGLFRRKKHSSDKN